MSPHSPWQLVEHMRICQRDILVFSVNPHHVSPEFPDGYWPDSPAPPSDSNLWINRLSSFRRYQEAAATNLTGTQQRMSSTRSHMVNGRDDTAMELW